MHYLHGCPLWVVYSNPPTNWGSVADWFQVGAVVAIGLLAFGIARRQIKMQDFVEIFVRYNSDRLEIRNVSSRIVYITKFTLNDRTDSLGLAGKLSLPTGENNFYQIPTPNPESCSNTIHLKVEFEDHLGVRYLSMHKGWFQSEIWAMQSIKAERIK